jgi:hypothetical protein
VRLPSVWPRAQKWRWRSWTALCASRRSKGYHLLPSVRGDLLHKLGHYEEAHAAFEAAAVLAGNRREHDLLRRRATEAADADTRSPRAEARNPVNAAMAGPNL